MDWVIKALKQRLLSLENSSFVHNFLHNSKLYIIQSSSKSRFLCWNVIFHQTSETRLSDEHFYFSVVVLHTFFVWKQALCTYITYSLWVLFIQNVRVLDRGRGNVDATWDTFTAFEKPQQTTEARFPTACLQDRGTWILASSPHTAYGFPAPTHTCNPAGVSQMQ